MEKFIFADQIQEITDEIESKILDGESTEISKLIKMTLENYKDALKGLTPEENIDVYQAVQASVKQRLSAEIIEFSTSPPSFEEQSKTVLDTIMSGKTDEVEAMEETSPKIEVESHYKHADYIEIAKTIAEMLDDEEINEAQVDDAIRTEIDVIDSNEYATDMGLDADVDAIKRFIEHYRQVSMPLEDESSLSEDYSEVAGPTVYGMPIDPFTTHDTEIEKLKNSSKTKNRVAALRTDRDPETIHGTLTKIASDEIEFIFDEEVYDEDSKSKVYAIAFNIEEAKSVFASNIIEEVNSGSSISQDLQIQYPLVRLNKIPAKITAKNLICENKIEALSMDIDFISPLKNYFNNRFNINLNNDAVAMIDNKLTGTYGERMSFHSYPKNVLENIVFQIIDNPESYKLYSVASKIKIGDKVLVLSLPNAPEGIVQEASNSKYKVAMGSIQDPFVNEYNEDELMLVNDCNPVMAEQETTNHFDAIKSTIDNRNKARESIKANLDKIDISKIDFKKFKDNKEAGWLAGIDAPDILKENDYTIGKEVELRSGIRATIKSHNRNNSLQVMIDDSEITIFLSEIKRGER